MPPDVLVQGVGGNAYKNSGVCNFDISMAYMVLSMLGYDF